MKIIERNNRNAPYKWKARCVCGSCNSILEVEEDDLVLYEGINPRTEKGWRFIAFRCAACSRMNKLPFGGIPMVVRERITHFDGLPSGGCDIDALAVESVRK